MGQFLRIQPPTLHAAVRSVPRSDLLSIIFESLGVAWKGTRDSKIVSVKSLGRSISVAGNKLKTYVNEKQQCYRERRLVESFKKDFQRGTGSAMKLPGRIRELAQVVLRMRGESLSRTIASGCGTVLAYLAIAGGADAEGGLPDMDAEIFGIGEHRNVFFHSVLAGFGVEFLLRFVFAFLRRVPINRRVENSQAWRSIGELSNSLEKGMVRGVWLGMAVHLLKDAAIFSDITKAYTGLPGSYSMGFHQALFSANAVAAGVFAIDTDGIESKMKDGADS